MLIQFSVRNFKVFRKEVCLSLIASNYDKSMEADNVFEMPAFGLRLLRSAVIYGANASGKTKLIDAVHFMRRFVLDSSRSNQSGDRIEVEPFRLNTESRNEPSMFEVVFLQNGEMFRYGFEVNASEVRAEWLYHRPKTKEVPIFYREGQDFDLHERQFRKGKFLVKEDMIRPNALMLSVAAQFNDALAERVLAWFQQCRQLSGLNEDGYMGFSMARAEDSKARAIALLREADIGIEDFAVKRLDPSSLPDTMSPELKDLIHSKVKAGVTYFEDVTTMHPVFDEQKRRVDSEEFSLKEEESSGTLKFFALVGPVLKALEDGEVIFMDELDAKLHPNLVARLVRLFHSPITNPRNAQLLFNTHNTQLLNADLFRRDQIWFVDKNGFGEASLYSLASFRTDEGVRKHDNFEKKYLQGRFGGVPVLGDFSQVMEP
jgi:uncharacterized protein